MQLLQPKPGAHLRHRDLLHKPVCQLLAPGFIEPASIDRIKTKFVYQSHYRLLGFGGIARYRQSDAIGRASRTATLEQMLGVNVVKGFHHRSAQLALNPWALRRSCFDFNECGHRVREGSSFPCLSLPRFRERPRINPLEVPEPGLRGWSAQPLRQIERRGNCSCAGFFGQVRESLRPP